MLQTGVCDRLKKTTKLQKLLFKKNHAMTPKPPPHPPLAPAK
jgi:hypothetical protein